MKKFPKPCKQTYAKQAPVMFVALPNPKDPTKPKRFYLGGFYERETREIYDYLSHLYAIGVTKENIATLLDSGVLKGGLNALVRASRNIENGLPVPVTTPTPVQTITIAELFERFIIAKSPLWAKDDSGHSPSVSRYKNILRRLSDFVAFPVDSFTRQHYESWRDSLVDYGYKRIIINEYASCLRSVFRWGVQKGIVKEQTYTSLMIVEPLKIGETVAGELNDRVSVPESTIYATLPYITSPSKEIVELLLLTGARPSEICSLNVNEIDKLTYPGVWLLRPSKHKNSHRGLKRSIPFNEDAQRIITEYIAKNNIRGGWVFPTRVRAGEVVVTPHITTNALRKAIRRACERQNIPVWSPYQLRHTVATITAKADPRAAQHLLGHSSIITTEKHYIDKDEQDAIRAAQSLKLREEG